MTVFDISPTIDGGLAVWPGDSPPSREIQLHMERGDNLTLSTLRSTVHLGAHADAPSHYGQTAPSIEAMSLERYWGECQVVRLTGRPSDGVSPADITGDIRAPRVLIVTQSYPDPTVFTQDFVPLTPAFVDWLADRKVQLIGVDTPSVDAFDSKDLPTHRRCLERDVVIVEGLVLDDVPEGLYEFIALPLKLAGFEASPVRAVLRSLDE